MNWEAFKIAAIGAAQTLTQGWSYKTLIAAILAIIFHRHAILFYGFMTLVFVDCFTKWIAISYNYLKEKGADAPPLWEAIIGIKKARAAKKIKSEVLKHRFLGKIAIYLICVFSAAVVDLTMSVLGHTTWAVTTIISYLVVTEALSIIENLNDAGVEAVQGLIDIIRRHKNI